MGAVHADFTQICVVSLEPFAATVDKDIDVKFAPRPDEDRPQAFARNGDGFDRRQGRA